MSEEVACGFDYSYFQIADLKVFIKNKTIETYTMASKLVNESIDNIETIKTFFDFYKLILEYLNDGRPKEIIWVFFLVVIAIKVSCFCGIKGLKSFIQVFRKKNIKNNMKQEQINDYLRKFSELKQLNQLHNQRNQEGAVG